MDTRIRKLAAVAIAGLMLGASSSVRCSFTFGQSLVFLSGLSIFGPLMGVFIGMRQLMFLLAGLCLYKSFVGGSQIPTLLVTAGLPTMVSAFCFRIASHRLSVDQTQSSEGFAQAPLQIGPALDICLRLALPALCMFLFIMHPIGYKACWYASFWLIPMACYAFEYYYGVQRFILATSLTALSSTFLAHAVGSVMWLYVFGFTPEYWLSLIPVVFVERAIFASAMVVIYSTFVFVTRAITSRYTVPSTIEQ